MCMQVLNGLLCELALYFLIYSEAANVRHCPEALWFLYWVAASSHTMEALWLEGAPNPVPMGRSKAISLRNMLQVGVGAGVREAGVGVRVGVVGYGVRVKGWG